MTDLAGIGLGPGAHDVDIVTGDDHARPNEELVGSRDKAGQVVAAAGRREGAGHAEQHDLLAGKKLGTRLRLDAIGRHHLEGCFRQFVAHLDHYSRRLLKPPVVPAARILVGAAH
jgi:hypothetical protein